MNPHEHYTDKELFACIAEGDQSAFTEFYLRYVKKLYPRISRMLEAESWAEEIIQEVFTKLWKVRHTLNEIDNPCAYLYRMAGNRTLDFLKQRSTEVKLRYQAARMYDTTSGNQTGQWFDFKQAEQLYREAVESLPEKRKIIFLLKHEGGLSYEEIAARLTLSTHTVRNQLTRAMDTIRKSLSEKGMVGVILFAILTSQ